MVNHSCEPNCVAVFDGNFVEIRTIADIKTGQEVNTPSHPNFSPRKLYFSDKNIWLMSKLFLQIYLLCI